MKRRAPHTKHLGVTPQLCMPQDSEERNWRKTDISNYGVWGKKGKKNPKKPGLLLIAAAVTMEKLFTNNSISDMAGSFSLSSSLPPSLSPPPLLLFIFLGWFRRWRLHVAGKLVGEDGVGG